MNTYMRWGLRALAFGAASGLVYAAGTVADIGLNAIDSGFAGALFTLGANWIFDRFHLKPTPPSDPNEGGDFAV